MLAHMLRNPNLDFLTHRNAGLHYYPSIFLQGVDQKILPCGQGRIDSVKINPSLLMMTDCPCSTKTREELGNPSPLPSRFPSTLEISLGLRPREILGVGDGFSNPSLLLVEHGYSALFV